MTLADKLRAAQVPVKPLVWAQEGKQPEDAVSLIGTYLLVRDFDGWRWMRVVGGNLADVCQSPFPDVELAKAAAEADHAASIRQALAPDPVREAMIEAVAALDAIAALSRVSGGTFARDYPALNRQLDDEPGEHWADVLSRYADDAMDKLKAALEPK